MAGWNETDNFEAVKDAATFLVIVVLTMAITSGSMLLIMEVIERIKCFITMAC